MEFWAFLTLSEHIFKIFKLDTVLTDILSLSRILSIFSSERSFKTCENVPILQLKIVNDIHRNKTIR